MAKVWQSKNCGEQHLIINCSYDSDKKAQFSQKADSPFFFFPLLSGGKKMIEKNKMKKDFLVSLMEEIYNSVVK